MTEGTLVLRLVRIPVDLDSKVRKLAYTRNVSADQLRTEFVIAGLTEMIDAARKEGGWPE